ncbi:MAG: signal recognition particle protein [Nitrospirota bacterium]
MWENLSSKLEGILKKLRGRGVLNEKDIDLALKDVKIALLEADVNFKVVKSFVERVKEKAKGKEVMESLTPGQQVVKIVWNELCSLMGEKQDGIRLSSRPPTIIMLVGLQGSGKTTTVGKLALSFKKEGKRVLLAAGDIKRPAAVEQLVTLGSQIGVEVHEPGGKQNPLDVYSDALNRAKMNGYNLLILDTAGRLHIDNELMDELEVVKDKISPHEILLVADAMTGQDAVNIAEEFNKRLNISGVILTKVDGDARGGAVLSIKSVTGASIKYVGTGQDAVNIAEEFNKRLNISGVILTKVDGDARGGAVLSIKSVTGASIKYVGTGEKLDALELFYPDRMASRILGMGDVLSLIEKAESVYSKDSKLKLEEKIRANSFTLQDFCDQLRQIKKMGPIGDLLNMIPGVGKLGNTGNINMPEKEIIHIEAIINSMTKKERLDYKLINGSRRRRIAKGSGTTVHDVNKLIKQFMEVRKMMKGMMGKGGDSFMGRNKMLKGLGRWM